MKCYASVSFSCQKYLLYTDNDLTGIDSIYISLFYGIGFLKLFEGTLSGDLQLKRKLHYKMIFSKKKDCNNIFSNVWVCPFLIIYKIYFLVFWRIFLMRSLRNCFKTFFKCSLLKQKSFHFLFHTIYFFLRFTTKEIASFFFFFIKRELGTLVVR